MKNEPITIQTVIKSPIKTVWNFWVDPKHITQWAFASDDWEAPYAENHLEVGSKFKTTMAAKDGSVSFDLTGTYTNIHDNKLIEYDLEDGRHVIVVFETVSEGTKVTQTFDPESENSRELQKNGWQAILENFKKHVESSS
jgi:uncharacterized protein YndB with AHSA1/START domain